MTKPTLNLIGAGRVGQTLAHLWHQRGTYIIQDVLTTRLDSAQAACSAIGSGRAVDNIEAMRPADVWMIAVQDSQIESAVISMQRIHPAIHLTSGKPPPMVFHCSGALSSTLLTPLATVGFHTASAHCILSFASVQTAVEQFPGTACALEGNTLACLHLHEAYTAIGAQCFEVKSENKVLYHAAAVFATNFLPILEFIAENAWRDSGVPEHIIKKLRSTLLKNSVSNITEMGPLKALTGPVARGDLQAIQKQLEEINKWDRLSGEVYKSISAKGLEIKTYSLNTKTQ